MLDGGFFRLRCAPRAVNLLQVKVYDSLKETGVAHYLLNIVVDFSQLFTHLIKSRPPDGKLEKDGIS